MGLRDAIRAHRSLYQAGNILHRDVSEANIILTHQNSVKDFTSILIDLDIARKKNHCSSGAPRRTGTMLFMAIEALRGKPHTYRHDLESFLYVLIWLCARRGWQLNHNVQNGLKSSLLRHWQTGDYETIANNKRGVMVKSGFDSILEKFHVNFNCVKNLCWKLRDILFEYNGDLFTGTKWNTNAIYDRMINAINYELKLILERGEGLNVALPSNPETQGKKEREGGGQREGQGERQTQGREGRGEADGALRPREVAKGVVTNPVRQQRCGKCRQPGHNRRKCQQV